MKRVGLVVLALFFFAASGRAEEKPRFEVFGGYSYGQLNPGGRLVAGSNPEGKHFGLSGWHVASQANLFKGVGLVADFSGYAGTSDIDLVAEHLRYYSFLAGPQLNIRKFGPLNIFAHGLVGVAKDRVFLKTGNPADNNMLTRFAGAFGGGMDIALTKHVAFRAFEADYILNTLPNVNALGQAVGAHQANARVSTGIVFRFGGR